MTTDNRSSSLIFASIALIGFIVIVFALLASGCGGGGDGNSDPIPALVAGAPITADPTPTPTGRAVYGDPLPERTPTPFGGFGNDGERNCDHDDDDPAFCEGH